MYRAVKGVKRAALYAAGMLWSAVTLYPMLFVLLSSFKNNDEIFAFNNSAFRLPEALRLENYYEALVTGNLAQSLLNSFILAGMSTLFVILLAAMVSFVLSRLDFKINGVIYLYFLLGIMIPVHATLVPLNRTISWMHGQNNYLVLAGIYTAFHLPLAVMIITGNMRGISRSMDESATLDGCGPFRMFLRIILPLSAPALSTVGIITFLYVYNDLLFGVMFISNKSMYTVTLAMQTFVGSKITTYGPIFASIIISIIPMIIVYLAFQSKVEAGLTAGAVKE